MGRSLFLILTMLSALCGEAVAQPSITAFPLESALVIDGVHEADLWIGADSAIGFTQMAPFPGQVSSQRSVAYIGFDSLYIYISVILYQETEVLAKAMNRDVLTRGDDAFTLVIDPYNDNRSGYGFWTNPLGTQTDFRINDDGRSIDVNWDTEWRTASTMHEKGWTLEMAIPFKSLRFKPGADTWGVNFGRIYLANQETSYWSGTLSDDFRISQGGKLTGITVPSSKSKLSLYPYATLRYENNEFTGVSHKVTPKVGGDIKWQ
ncbi:MAG: carbohydrate binding family 9 domain-containing protein, partial [Bacteroidales bacterium]|nr:carbohydrate binding family 9 domain-containing protein [Bacteroidales bacterium]